MIVGGSAGSTTGDLKLARAAWLIKAALAQVSNGLRPTEGRATITFDGETVEEGPAARLIRHAAGLAVLWMTTLGFATVALTLLLPDSRASELGFEAASAFGSVGLTTGITGPSMPVAADGILIVLMWLGRLEIVLLLVPLVARPRQEESRS